MKDQTQTTINAQDFISYLMKMDLVIVSRNEFLKEKEREQEKERKQILNQKLIRISDAAKLLNQTSQNIHRKINSGIIKKHQYKTSEKDKRKTKYLTRECVLELIENRSGEVVINEKNNKTATKKKKNKS